MQAANLYICLKLSCDSFPNGFSAGGQTELLANGVGNGIEPLQSAEVGGNNVATVNQQRSVLSRVVGVLFMSWIATVIACDIKHIVVLQKLNKFGNFAVDFFQRFCISVNVSTMPELHIGIDQVYKHKSVK